MSDGNGLAKQQLAPVHAGPPGSLADVVGAGLPASLKILLDDKLYEQIRRFSGIMAKSDGMIPAHLIGKPEACFQVICMALDSRLNPIFVARHTYQTPSGVVGIDGALTQAVLEMSGKFYGAPVFEHVGNWETLHGKFELRKREREYNGKTRTTESFVRTWTKEDAKGLGVIVRWHAIGEEEPRVWPGDGQPFLLNQVSTMNSPLWATDPKTQICYLAIRRFANITSPGIFGSSAFGDAEILDASDRAMDVTPREPIREDFTEVSEATEAEPETEVSPAMDPDEGAFAVTSVDGEVTTYVTETEAANALYNVLVEASRNGTKAIDTAWENNHEVFALFSNDLAANVANDFATLRAGADEKERARVQPPETAQEAQEPPMAQQQPPSASRATAPPSAAPDPSERTDEPSQEIPPPMRDGKPIWKTWAIALLAPKIRRQTTTVGLAKLLGDNDTHLEAIRNGVLDRADLKALEDTIREQFEKIGPEN